MRRKADGKTRAQVLEAWDPQASECPGGAPELCTQGPPRGVGSADQS